MTVKIPPPLNLFSENKSKQDWFFLVYSKLTDDLNTKTATSYTPEITKPNSNIISNISNNSSYIAINEVIHIFTKITFNLDEDLSSINLSLPFNASNDCVLTGTFIDSAEVLCFAKTEGDSNKLNVRKYNGGDLLNGTNRSVTISGFFRTKQSY